MSTKKVLVVVALIGLLTGGGGVLTGVAVANHQWSDVPTSDFFHDAIDDFTDAGCASGYPDGTFRPTQPVLRQQMARFIASCAGRIGYDEVLSHPVPTTDTAVPGLDAFMTAGAVGDGGGFVHVQVDAHAYSADTTGYPCEVRISVGNAADPASRETFIDLPANTADTFEDGSSSVEQFFDLGAGFNSTQPIRVMKSCSANVAVDLRVTTTYWPFDSSGDGGASTLEEPVAQPPRG
jgi:hypothetical protein